MESGEDELMRPVLAGALKYESLLDCTVDLVDVARINDALNVKAENETRLIDAGRH